MRDTSRFKTAPAVSIKTGLATSLLLAAAPVAHALTGPIQPGSASVKLQPFLQIPSADGSPQDMVSAYDGSGRMFISTRNGKIRLVDSSGSFLDSSASPFLDLTAAGISLYTAGEGGFPGVAFSPTFATDKLFYTFSTETYNAANAVDFSHPELAPTTVVSPSVHIVIREWSVNESNPNLANSTSRTLMRINASGDNHLGGALRFDQAGNLLIAIGDGGAGDDRINNPSNPTDGHTNDIGNGQDTEVVFGKILRIDPKGNNSVNGQYGIPAANPFVGAAPGLDEVYAYGLRNPYRISVDPNNGDIMVGDVGQFRREEIDRISSGGGNYGWTFREGTFDHSADFGAPAPPGFTSIDPIAEYTHGDGAAVMGGFIYHGTKLPQLYGKYVFGDFYGTIGKARLFYMDANGGLIQSLNFDLTGDGVATNSLLYGFGEDAEGELYAMLLNRTILQLNTPVIPKWIHDGSDNWSAASRWLGGVVPDGASASVALTDGTQPITITLDSARTVGTMSFNCEYSYTIAGTSTLTIDQNLGSGAILSQLGHHTISAPVMLAKNTQITVASGTCLAIIGDLSAAAGVTLTKAGSGELSLKSLRLDSAAISAGTVKVLDRASGGTTSLVKSLSIAGTTDAWIATLDLDDTNLVIDYAVASPLATVANQLKSGFHNGAWDGAGITSSHAAAIAADSGNLYKTALGYAEASDLGLTTFDGLLLEGDAIIVRYTFTGDANLDGVVNMADFNALALHFNQAGEQWVTGDFNYDGFVNALDFNSVASNFGSVMPAFAMNALVPEPSLAAILAAVPLLNRRRSRRS